MATIFDKYYDVIFDSTHPVYVAIREITEWSMTGRPNNEDILISKNEDLCDVELDRLDTHIIVTILRSTFIFRELLECWADKVDEAEVILTKRGLPANKILRGLKRFT